MIRRLEADRRRAAELNRDPAKLHGIVIPLARKLQKVPVGSEASGRARSELKRELSWLRHHLVHIPQDVGNELAEVVIQTYNAYAGARPDYLSLEVAARYGNNRAVKDFLARILQKGTKDEKRALLTELAWSESLRGDQEIFHLLKGMYQRETGKRSPILAAMRRIDAGRTLPMVLADLDTTRDPEALVSLGGIVCAYDRLDLTERVLGKVREFSRRGSGGARVDPSLAVYPEQFLKYLVVAEGEKLALALGVLEKNPLALGQSHSLLLEKLDKGSVADRRVILRFWKRVTVFEEFADADILTDMKSRFHRESNNGVKADLQAVIAAIEEKLGHSGP